MNCVMINTCLKSFSRNFCGVMISILFAVMILSGCGEEQKARDTSKRLEYSNDEVSLRLVIDNTEILLVDDIKITLTAAAPQGWTISFPEMDKEMGAFSVIGEPEIIEKIDTNTKGIVSVMTLAVSAAQSGKVAIPELLVTYADAGGGKELTLKTDPVEVNIKSLLSESAKAELKDIYNIFDLQRDYTLWYIIGAICLVLLAILLTVLVLKYYRKKAIYKAICLPFFTALKKLELLENSGNIEKGLDDVVYTEVSDILRYYIESRFGITASKITTEEFLIKISDEKLLINNYADLLKDFLQKCDVVKFAKYDASESECHAVINSCREFVLGTKRDEIHYYSALGKMER